MRLGKPEATREEVMAALKNAQCDDILEKLPDGMDTVIGTKGSIFPAASSSGLLLPA